MPRAVRLRPLSSAEHKVLREKLRDLSLSARIHQRYRIVAEVLKGHAVGETADRVGCHFTVAYDWIRRFNESGFATFEQVPNPRGRPPILKAEQLRELVEVALSSPAERGLPFSNWSVPKLTEYCRQRRLLPPVTDEWVRRLLRREGLTAQRIRTWKTSHDPDFDRKKNASGGSTGAARRPRR
jgi:transposase